MNETETVDTRTRVVVLGAGFAGLEFCQTLRDPRFAITLVDRANHHLFQPLLYQVATGGLSAPEIAQPIRSILRDRENVTVLMDEVTGLDVAARRVTLEKSVLEYDYLILATGARTGWFGHDEWAQHAIGLKTLDDATLIRSRVLRAYEEAEMCEDSWRRQQLLTTVVVGGGATGVEMAGSLAELSRKVLARDFRRIHPPEARVVLLEAGPRVLGTFDPELSEYARKRLLHMGVDVRTGTAVAEIGPGIVRLEEGAIAAETVIWAAGVEASPLTRDLGVRMDRAGRVLVRPDCSVPGHPEIFAIGDLASLTDAKNVRVPGVAPAASQMGRHVARVIQTEVRRLDRFTGGFERPPFVYLDKGSMATIGRSAAVAAAFGLKFRGFLAWVMWLFVHLLFLVGFRNRISVVIQWIYSYFTWRRGARIITR